MNGDNVTYFDSFGVKNIPKRIKTFTSKKISKQTFIEYKQIIQK